MTIITRFLRLMAVFIVLRSHWASGFATYVLSRAGCYTEMETDEVIMGHYVEAAIPEALVQIVLADDDDNDQDNIVSVEPRSASSTAPLVVHVAAFPVTVQFQVVPTQPGNGVRGYEYILQLDEQASGSFDHGSCDDDKRVAGQSPSDLQQVTLQAPGAVVWGAWAAGHEAVKLLQGYRFELAANPNSSHHTHEDNEARETEVQGEDEF